jgi:hypothetical protein
VAFYIVENMAKICIKCGEIKELNEFNKHKLTKDGLCGECKQCRNIVGEQWRKNNPDKVKIWYDKNKIKIKEYSKQWRQTNHESIKFNNKKWKKNNPDKVKANSKRYYINNKEILNKKGLIWAKNNINKVRQYRIKSAKKDRDRRKNDIRFRLKKRFSTAIYTRLKKRLFNKDSKSMWDFVPYTIDDLIKHLESKFEPWMNWQNYGKQSGCWSIDHIKPDSLFHYKSIKDKEFQECWDLSNLRPLEHIKNLQKSNKFNNIICHEECLAHK